MESLNMLRLNLSSVLSPARDRGARDEVVNVKPESNTLLDPDDEMETEFQEEVWKNLLQQEAEKPPLQLQSPQLEFRGTLVQQLREVSRKLKWSISTLHAAVALLDLFMDAHRLRADRLSHVALACLSLAAKSEEMFSHCPRLLTLSTISGIQLNGKMFRQLEWMVGQHVKWRLLAPTPVTFAALLARFVVTDADLTTRHPKFVRRFKRDGVKLLEAFLDLTLSDVRLKVVSSVDVGCACVACARADLGLCAWPEWLAKMTGKELKSVAPYARLLQRMMKMVKSRKNPVKSDVDQGYDSARTSPSLMPCASPVNQIPTVAGTSTSSLDIDGSFRADPDGQPGRETDRGFATQRLNVTSERVNGPADLRLFRSLRLIDGNLEQTMAVKRGPEGTRELAVKRCRPAQAPEAVL